MQRAHLFTFNDTLQHRYFMKTEESLPLAHNALQDSTEKHFGDVGILGKHEDNNNNVNQGW